MTVDNKGKLWVFTDNGIVYKFKRPGKIDFEIQAVDIPMNHPRIAVVDDILFITSNDKIHALISTA